MLNVLGGILDQSIGNASHDIDRLLGLHQTEREVDDLPHGLGNRVVFVNESSGECERVNLIGIVFSDLIVSAAVALTAFVVGNSPFLSVANFDRNVGRRPRKILRPPTLYCGKQNSSNMLSVSFIISCSDSSIVKTR